MVVASKLGFSPRELKVLPESQVLNFTLKKGEVTLKEIIVKSPLAQRRGDTLSFKVEEFKSDADRSIGDVIKKLPGVEMDKYGRILYQGKPINRYYIENMNLLDGRYGLANDNLPHGKVTVVEIMENHQPIRILDSLSFSDQAAINIKLKNKVTKTGVLHYGVGAKPFIWDLNATPMVFVPNWQFLGSFQSNNIGKSSFSTFQDFFQYGSPIKQNWLQVSQLNVPPFSEKRYLDNVSHAGSLNTLKRSKKDFEFKLNASLILDKLNQKGDEQVTFFLNNESFGYTENTRNSFRTNQASIALNLEKNTVKDFFKNNLTFEQEWQADHGINIRQDRTYNQNNKTGNFRLSNNFHKIFKRKNHQYNFYSLTTLLHNKQGLSVNLIGEDYTASPFQNFVHTGFSTHNYADLSRRIAKRISLGMRVGSEISLSNFKTELNQYGLNTDTTNNFNWNNYKTYVAGILNFKTQKWQASLNLPLSYYVINYKPDKTEKNFLKLVTEPHFNLRFKSTPSTEFYVDGKYINSLSRPGDLYSGFVMRSYLNLTRKDADFADNHNYSSRAGINHNNLASGFSFNSSYGVVFNVQNQLPQNQISMDGSGEMNYALWRNTSRTHSGNLTIRKYIFLLKTSLSTGATLSKNESDVFVNGDFQRYSFKRASPEAHISFNGFKWLEFNYRANFFYSNNTTTSQTVTNYSQSWSTGFSKIKNAFVLFTFEHNKIKTSQTSRGYLFGDILLRYTLPKIKQDFEFSLTNIFNKDSFETIHLNNYIVQQTNFQLRPRQILFRGRISF